MSKPTKAHIIKSDDIKWIQSELDKLSIIRVKAEKLLKSPSGTLTDIGEMVLKELKLL